MKLDLILLEILFFYPFPLLSQIQTHHFIILDRETRIDPENPESSEPELMIMAHIELHNVYFAYPTRPKVMVFQGFSINIEAGKSTAIVGQCGLGKSSII